MTLPKIHGIAFIEDTIHLFEKDTYYLKSSRGLGGNLKFEI
jgi:hypothetical protein